MKHFYYLLVFVAFLNSCSNEQFDNLGKIDESSRNHLKSSGDGLYDILGFGFDITKTYNGLASTYPVLNLTNLTNRIEKGDYNISDIKIESGSDVLDFNIKFGNSDSGSFTLLKGLSAYLNYGFNGSYLYSSKYAFSYFNMFNVRKRFSINGDISIYINNLDDVFQNYLNSQSPSFIVEKYGTHFLTEILLGSKFELFYRSQTTSTNRSAAVTAGMAAKLKDVFSYNGSLNADMSLAITNSDQAMYCRAIGGNSINVQYPSDSIAPKIDINAWSTSANTAKPEFIFAGATGLIPLYELVSDPSKKAALKSYIENYIASKNLKIGETSVGGIRKISGLGNENQGGGVAMCDIDKNGIQDMILMGIDNPKGTNEYWYKILYDVDQYGNSYRESEILRMPTRGSESADGGITIADINKNGIPDLIFMETDNPSGPNPMYYKVAFDVNQFGQPSYYSDFLPVSPMGNDFNGSDLSSYDINGNGIPDLIFLAYDAPSGLNNFRYKIGWDVDPSGKCSSFSQYYIVDGVGDLGEGSGIAVSDIDNNGRPDLILMAIDSPNGENHFKYKVVKNLDKSGFSSSVLLGSVSVPNLIGTLDQGAGACFADINHDNKLELIFLAIDNGPSVNEFRYLIGFDINQDSGTATLWR